MPDSFGTRLAELRKQQQLSQKEAAQALGISQALLSHYENGIRECGLDFVIKTAKFFGVTCDYLLCNSNSKYGFSDIFNFEITMPDDSILTTATIYRAAAALREALGNTSEEFSRQTLVLYAVCIYRVLLFSIGKGKVPANWLNIEGISDFDQYINTLDSLLLRVLNVPGRKAMLKYDPDAEMPECLKTIIDSAHEAFTDRAYYFTKTIAKRKTDSTINDENNTKLN